MPLCAVPPRKVSYSRYVESYAVLPRRYARACQAKSCHAASPAPLCCRVVARPCLAAARSPAVSGQLGPVQPLRLAWNRCVASRPAARWRLAARSPAAAWSLTLNALLCRSVLPRRAEFGHSRATPLGSAEHECSPVMSRHAAFGFAISRFKIKSGRSCLCRFVVVLPLCGVWRCRVWRSRALSEAEPRYAERCRSVRSRSAKEGDIEFCRSAVCRNVPS